MSESFTIDFEDFGPEEYLRFLAAKKVPEFAVELDAVGLAAGISMPLRFAHMVGESVAVPQGERVPLPTFLFADQAAILHLALAAERFAVWSDCGLGKTLIELEFARQVVALTGGKVLMFTLPDIVREIVSEAAKFYGAKLPVTVLASRAEMRDWCKAPGRGVAVTNYEKMNPDPGPEGQIVPELRWLAGVVLDESSRLKTGGGKQKWALVKSCRGIRYKLSCTATPAPNEVMEFASQASFLERISDEHNVMWSYFTRDPVTNEWTVKAHARPHFFRWMASWSIYVRDPARYGWERRNADGAPVPAVPEPVFLEHRIVETAEQRALAQAVALDHAPRAKTGGMLDLFTTPSLDFVGRGALSQLAKGFRYRGKEHPERVPSLKPGFVADLVKGEVAAGLRTLVWCIFDEEVEVLAQAFRERKLRFGVIGGSTSDEAREAQLAAFRAGQLDVLIAKAAMLGYGVNLQCVRSMVFSGFNDSFEQFYQAVRRAYRFGQIYQLRVHLPYIPTLEEPVLRNVLRKAAQFVELIEDQENAYVAALEELKAA